MNSTSPLLSEMVTVDASFKAAVHLPDDFENDEQNARLISTYIPSSRSIQFLAEVARSLNPASNERARMLTGTFGTGKSDLLLMICNYFSRSVDDPIMQPFYERLKRLNEAHYTTIYQQRLHQKPFLVVLLQANAITPFPGFILHGLEQALKRAKIEDLMLPTRYAAAIQKVEEWQQESHPVLQRFITNLRDNEALDLATLLKELAGPSADLAFPSFLRSFRVATGTAFDIYGYNRPETTYKYAAHALRERGNHSGILIVCDEFTELIRRLANTSEQRAAELEAEALGVQDLANTSVASGLNQLHFIISSLESFASSSAESSSGTGSKTVEKIGGRFKSFELDLQDSAELIRGAIRRLDDRAVFSNMQRDELFEIARARWPQASKQWLFDYVIDGCFPLHPLVSFALPLINRQVAQNNRTMFQFLKDEQGLSGFLSQSRLASMYPAWTNLLCLDHLYDYFEKSIEVRRSEITDAYRHGLQLLEQTNVDITLARRVLKCVAFCEVLEPMLSPTCQVLGQALNLPHSAEASLREALDILEQVEAIYPPSDSETESLGAYSLPMSGRVNAMNLKQRVRSKAREMHANVARLQSKYPADAIKADEYNRRFGSHRELMAKFVSVQDLHSSSRLKDDLNLCGDGLLWYVIATSETERSDAQSRARELTRQHPRLLLAVPLAPLSVLDALKNYEALEIIRSDAVLDGAAKDYLKDSGRVGQGFYTTLSAAITRLRDPKQWEWFRDGASQPTVITLAHVQDLATKIMSVVFSSTPTHTLPQHFKATGVSPSLSRAMAEVLKGEVRISKTGNKPEEAILRTAMVNLGLLKLLRTDGPHQVFALSVPDGAAYNSHKVWQLYVNHLTNKKAWNSLLEILRREPFGLYDSLLTAFTATFLTYYADGIEISSSLGQPIALDAKLLKDLIDSPKNYVIRLQPLNDTEKQWLRGIVIHGLKKTIDSSGSHGKTLRVRVAAQVKTWLAMQHLPLFADKIDEDFLNSLFSDMPQHVIQTAVLLLQASRSEERIAALLLNEVPTLFGVKSHETWSAESLEELFASWSQVCHLIEQLAQTLENYAIHRVASIFGCEQEAVEKQWWSIYDWRKNRQIIHNQVAQLPTYMNHFFRLSFQPDGSIRKSFLDEFAKQVIGINTEYQSWSTLEHLDRVVKEIQKARDEIDSRWRLLANAEDIWHDGVASAALGRPVSGVDADTAAASMHKWTTVVSWPCCVDTIQFTELTFLYPSLDTQAIKDLSAMLARVHTGVDDWKRELSSALARQFGVENWTKAEVEQAIKRLRLALEQATNFDVLFRKHCLSRLLQLFSSNSDANLSGAELVRAWRSDHPIPLTNDLNQQARAVLLELESNADLETILLISLPRAIPQIEQSYHQWQTYADLERYLHHLESAIKAIELYTPLTQFEQRWLTGIVEDALRRPLTDTSHEKHCFTRIVGTQLVDWLHKQDFPAFVPALTFSELQHLIPDSSESEMAAIATMLQMSSRAKTEPDLADFIWLVLPQTLTNNPTINPTMLTISEEELEAMLEALSSACSKITQLNAALIQQLFDKIAALFGIQPSGENAAILLTKLRSWRHGYVLFDNEPLSDDAAFLLKMLSASGEDADKLLLTTLPMRLRDVQAPYAAWQSWQKHQSYLKALEAASLEIAECGKVGAATAHVQVLWENLKKQFAGLSRDEQRWLLKAFNEEFRL